MGYPKTGRDIIHHPSIDSDSKPDEKIDYKHNFPFSYRALVFVWFVVMLGWGRHTWALKVLLWLQEV